MRRFLAATTVVFPLAAWAAPATDLAAVEKTFDAAIKPDDLRGWMERMASAPNHVGGPHDKENAAWQAELFRAWGWDTRIETFEVMYPTPISMVAELVGPTRHRAAPQETPIAGDKATADLSGALPPYVAYQGDGDVQAGLVYVNYGMPEDYEQLARLGVDVRGKIAIARYGKGWRGLKPKLAQEHGAVGCLIYSDPGDDGYAVDKPYPEGPMRPPQGVQRGSVADMPLYPGDPTTPDIAPTKDAKRLPREQAKTILKIPVLPVSYADAQVFLSALGGPVAPASWRGALPITYHVGPGAAELHLAVKSDWKLRTIYDVIATMKGAVWPDQWVLRGNHHDGWVFGASDPLSGQVAMMAEAKAIGALAKQGFRPKRTLVYASWDAEEPMLVGSTAWTQAHAAERKRHAMVYINTDTSGRGVFTAEASGDFAHLVSGAADSVTDPETGATVGARARAALRVAAQAGSANAEDKHAGKLAALKGHDLPVGPLGSGSDYSPFLQHLGLAAINVAFTGEGQTSGIYHSAYDTFAHHAKFVDPGFVYDALLAHVAGRIVLRTAEADLPPQRPAGLAEDVAFYVDDLKRLLKTKQEEQKARAELLRDGAYLLAVDPTRPLRPPPALDPVPALDFGALEQASAGLGKAAASYEAALGKAGTLPPEKLAKLQALMLTLPQTLAPTEGPGLPFRPWYRNLVYAPGRFTGYGAKTLPGVREAIEERRWADAQRYVGLTAAALDAYSARLREATAVVAQ